MSKSDYTKNKGSLLAHSQSGLSTYGWIPAGSRLLYLTIKNTTLKGKEISNVKLASLLRP